MAHFAGLVAAGLHPSPVPHAHVTTTTTHKTLGGPRGGVILTNDPEIAKKINSAVFPGQQGGPLEHVIAAKAVAFKMAAEPVVHRPGSAARCEGAATAGRAAGPVRRGRGRDQRADRRHRRAPGAGRPARRGAGRQGGRGPAARGGHHGEPQRGAVRPAAADGHLRAADRHPGAGHPRVSQTEAFVEVADIIASALLLGEEGTRAEPAGWPSCGPGWTSWPSGTRSIRGWATLPDLAGPSGRGQRPAGLADVRPEQLGVLDLAVERGEQAAARGDVERGLVAGGPAERAGSAGRSITMSARSGAAVDGYPRCAPPRRRPEPQLNRRSRHGYRRSVRIRSSG